MRISFQKTTALVSAMAALLLFAAGANADTIVFNNAPDTGSQQDFVLGMDFTVNSAVTVTQLGSFDSNGNGFANDIQVGIFSTSGGGPLVSTILSGSSGVLTNGTRFVPIAPFLLLPGTYSIVAAGYTGGFDFSGNTGFGDTTSFNNAGGALSLITGGGRWDLGNTFQLPTAGSYPQADPVFQAGSFAVLDTLAVPDGGSASMMLGFGLLAAGWIRRLIK